MKENFDPVGFVFQLEKSWSISVINIFIYEYYNIHKEAEQIRLY